MPLLVEMGWGGLVQLPTTITWTDITRLVNVVQGVTISRGASDEFSETQPGTCVMCLDNQDGWFTPGNALSPYAPYVRRNAPVRVSAVVIPSRTGSAPYPMAMLGDDFDDDRINTVLWPSNYGGATEVAGRARVPVTAAGTAAFQTARVWSLVGSKLTAKLVTLPGVNGSSAAVASMWVNSTTGGTRLGWRYNAITGTIGAENQTSFFDGTAVAVAYNPRDYAWLRVRESAGTIYWESSGDGFGWTVRRTLAAPAWVAAQTHAVEFPTTRTGGTPDYVEWDLVGAEVRPRFYGMVNEFPVQWEGLLSTVTISCTDLFKRLNRLPPLRSMLAEEILLDGPSVYYPLTEPSDSVSAGDVSGSGMGGALAIQQTSTGGTVEFAAGVAPAATGDQAVQLTPASNTAGKYLRADLSAAFVQAGLARDLVMEAWFSTTVQGRNIMTVYDTGDLSRIIVYLQASTGYLTVESRSPDTTSTAVAGSTNLADGKPHHVVVVTDSAGVGRVYVDGVNLGTAIIITAFDYNRLVVGASHNGLNLWDGAISHVALYADHNLAEPEFTGHYTAGASAYSGEAADTRIQRLARYAGINSVTVWGTTHDPVAGQGAGGSSVVARMREVEATESGRLWAERDWYGLAYQSRDVRYNPDPSQEVFTIDYADLETRGVELSDDDQKLCNTVDGTRPGGATQRVSAPQSVLAFGMYEKSLDILKTTDNAVLDAAAWLVSRYANPLPELREVPIEAHTMAFYLDILDAEIGGYFSVYNLPAQAPASTLRVTVEGYTETLKHNSHNIQFHTSTSSTDSVWVLDDTTYSVLGSTTRLAY
ncbi:LamG-like jellyroll fold domain-containing protein [Streptomyces sp. NPDC047070]|uniref:LamG-like jellyroll fold domain-containing protein n=1 Tax=Streptomyces sp. NPDC047070 TaxID=3154923 RepID=UPI0034539E3C